jgi:hypothetical protein
MTASLVIIVRLINARPLAARCRRPADIRCAMEKSARLLAGRARRARRRAAAVKRIL